MSYLVERSVKKLEEEIENLEKDNGVIDEEKEEKVEEVQEKPKGPEETWQKRYSDLRSYSQKEINSLKAKIEQLEKRAPAQTLPVTPEEAEDWAKNNPKSAAIIRSLAAKEVNVTPVATDLEELRKDVARTREEAAIRKAIPDFDDIVNDDDFHEWAENQPETIQKIIYESNKASDTIWAINAYKTFKSKNADPKKEAAKSVNKSKASEPKGDLTKGRFSESMVAKMSPEEFEKNEAAIMQSQKEGTFVYDRSGGAR